MMERTNGIHGPAAIEAAFAGAKAEGRAALITYLTAGYPDAAATLQLAPALAAGGADLIELGVPFSDPVADGPAIQHAGQIALQAGITPRGCLALAAELRRAGVAVPLILMGYYNPIQDHGLAAYVADCAAAGVDGLIVPDLPLEEAGPLAAACRAGEVALIMLVAPTSGEARVAALAEATSGFFYVVSRLGITGGELHAGQELEAQLAMVRRHARTPVAVGFGVSRPEQAAALAPHADGVIVGSAVVQRAAEGPEALRAYVAGLRAAL